MAAFELLKEILILGEKLPLCSELSSGIVLNISGDTSLFKFMSHGSKQAKPLEKALKNSSECAHAIHRLEKLLPILNGLVYMQQPAKDALISHFQYTSPFSKSKSPAPQSALSALVSLLLRALPYSELEEVLFILNNLAAGVACSEESGVLGLINYL